jgi:ribulose 1,5-bisphosphate synthetase/thiazole synthase
MRYLKGVIVRASDYKYPNESSATCITEQLMSNNYDVIVIGGGHNGLVNAAYLAPAGEKLCPPGFDKREAPGVE